MSGRDRYVSQQQIAVLLNINSRRRTDLKKIAMLIVRQYRYAARIRYLDILLWNFSVVHDNLLEVAHFAQPYALVSRSPVILHIALVTVGVGGRNG